MDDKQPNIIDELERRLGTGGARDYPTDEEVAAAPTKKTGDVGKNKKKRLIIMKGRKQKRREAEEERANKPANVNSSPENEWAQPPVNVTTTY